MTFRDAIRDRSRSRNGLTSRALFLGGLAIATLLGGCKAVSEHQAAVQYQADDQLTVGTVQREVRVGMSSAEVVQVLGSPNVVTTDEKRREVWVYDKIATDRAYSTSYGGISALVLGGTLVGAGLVGAAVAPSYGASTGASSTSQRTLTVVIKFDEQNTVRDFAYHTSRF